jgi:hypothetical protein
LVFHTGFTEVQIVDIRVVKSSWQLLTGAGRTASAYSGTVVPRFLFTYTALSSAGRSAISLDKSDLLL